MRRIARPALLLPATLVIALGLETPPGAQAQPTEGACDVVEVEYALAATLHLSDTPHGAGNGSYAVGPGTVVVRLDRRDGRAQMASYQLTERFTIQSSALFWSATVVTDTRTHATPARCPWVAEGALVGRTLRWTSPVTGYATDGTLTCDGSLCGSFGAPPPGKSEIHVPPHAVMFSPFELSPDGKTFTMQSTFVTKTDAPKQTAHVALAGRETKRTCLRAEPTCP